MGMTDKIEALRELAEKATPGPWKAVSAPNFDNGLVYTSVQPVTVDEDAMKPLAMMNGEYHVCRMSHTAAEWRFSYHRANAAYIAAASPDVILSLLSELDRLRSSNEAMLAACEEMEMMLDQEAAKHSAQRDERQADKCRYAANEFKDFAERMRALSLQEEEAR